jgi:hypothetical protein
LQDSSNARITESYVVTIKEECTRHDIYYLHFLNVLGGYDTFSFTGAPSQNIVSDKSFYTKRLGEWSGTTFGFSVEQRGTTQYATTSKKTIKLVSDWITEEQSEWLQEMVSSPDAYIVNSTSDALIPINIIDTNYQIKTIARDRLFNLELTIELSYTDIRQGA